LGGIKVFWNPKVRNFGHLPGFSEARGLWDRLSKWLNHPKLEFNSTSMVLNGLGKLPSFKSEQKGLESWRRVFIKRKEGFLGEQLGLLAF